MLPPSQWYFSLKFLYLFCHDLIPFSIELNVCALCARSIHIEYALIKRVGAVSATGGPICVHTTVCVWVFAVWGVRFVRVCVRVSGFLFDASEFTMIPPKSIHMPKRICLHSSNGSCFLDSTLIFLHTADRASAAERQMHTGCERRKHNIESKNITYPGIVNEHVFDACDRSLVCTKQHLSFRWSPIFGKPWCNPFPLLIPCTHQFYS